MSDDNYVTVEVSMHEDLYESIDSCRSVPPKRIRFAARNSPRVTATTDSDSVAWTIEGAIAKFSDVPSQE